MSCEKQQDGLCGPHHGSVRGPVVLFVSVDESHIPKVGQKE